MNYIFTNRRSSIAALRVEGCRSLASTAGAETIFILYSRQRHNSRGGKGKLHDKKYVLMTKRVGSTTFRVKVHFKDEGNQTMEDKLLKIISENLLANKKKCATIETPQMSRSAGEELS